MTSRRLKALGTVFQVYRGDGSERDQNLWEPTRSTTLDPGVGDLFVIFVLGILGLAAGWWHIGDTHRSVVRRLDWPRIQRLAEGIVRNRDTQVFVATFMWIATFWVATLSTQGLGAARRLVDGPPAPPPREVVECYRSQEDLFMAIQDGVRTHGRPVPSALPDSSLPCPEGGTYQLDSKGYIDCSQHGKHPRLPSVYDIGKPGYTSWARRY